MNVHDHLIFYIAKKLTSRALTNDFQPPAQRPIHHDFQAVELFDDVLEADQVIWEWMGIPSASGGCHIEIWKMVDRENGEKNHEFYS